VHVGCEEHLFQNLDSLFVLSSDGNGIIPLFVVIAVTVVVVIDDEELSENSDVFANAILHNCNICNSISKRVDIDIKLLL